MRIVALLVFLGFLVVFLTVFAAVVFATGFSSLATGFTGEEVYGFSIKGAKYPLDNHTLIPYDSLCVSNQFQEDEVTISFMKGIVILMETKDR